MFTQRAALLGFVAFTFYLIAVVNTLPSYYYALTWLSMAMLAASLGVALLSLIGLDCRLEVTRSRGAAPLEESSSASALAALALSNAGTLNKTNVVLELRVSNAQSQVQSLRFLVEALPSGASIESILPLTGLRRGRYRLREARLMGSDVLGLFRTHKTIPLREQAGRELIIGPPILLSETNLQGGTNGWMSGQQRALIARHGDELRGTRPYAPGDDLRHVHWKSSARAGELVVKEWEQTGQSSALVIWDGAAQTTWGEGDFDSGEWGLILSASLCQAFLSSGTPCDFARIDASPLLTEARALVGGELPTEMTDALSGAVAARAFSLEDGLSQLPRMALRLGSKPILVSASLSEDLVGAVMSLVARGAQVQVVLVDSASLAVRSGDRRFRGKSTSKIPTQGEGARAVPVSSASFQFQCSRLREVGAAVVPVSAQEGQSAEQSLRAALRLVAQGPKVGFVSG